MLWVQPSSSYHAPQLCHHGMPQTGPSQQQCHGVTSPRPAGPSSAHHCHRARQAGHSPCLRRALLCTSQAPTGPEPQGAPHCSPPNSPGLQTWCLFSAALKRAPLWFIVAPQDLLLFILSSPAWPQRTPPLVPEALLWKQPEQMGEEEHTEAWPQLSVLVITSSPRP